MTKLCKGSLVLCRLLTLLFLDCFLLHYFAVAKIAGIGATHIMLTGFALRDDNENEGKLLLFAAKMRAVT